MWLALRTCRWRSGRIWRIMGAMKRLLARFGFGKKTARPRKAREEAGWVEIELASSEAQAYIVKGRLEAEGLRAIVKASGRGYRAMLGEAPAGASGGGNWQVMVPRWHAERAEAILKSAATDGPSAPDEVRRDS